MKTENIQPETKKGSVMDTESHSYNNPDDIVNIMDQETEILHSLKVKIEQQAAYLDMIEEDGSEYVVVKNRTDNTTIYKSRNPIAKAYLFKKD